MARVARRWEIFCRVIDNFGDIGVCWRLAHDLAERGEAVRLWADDASALRWMAPLGHAGVQLGPWSEAQADAQAQADCGDVVIEAFGCTLPDGFVQRMAARARAPLWINLEYLTAQAFAARNHGLPSPQLSGAGAGLSKWFFHPGFVASTGGLIRERDLESRQSRFDAHAWRESQGFKVEAGERCVSLFCYGSAALPELIDALSRRPTLVLAAPGAATEQLRQWLGASMRRGALRGIAMPWLSQQDFDHLLWSCDLNFVRGEDSWVRAQWADRPFMWQPYVQSDAAHHAKLQAFLDLYLANAGPALARDVRALAGRWNDFPSEAAGAALEIPDPAQWQDHQRRWRTELCRQADLTAQLLSFVNARP